MFPEKRQRSSTLLNVFPFFLYVPLLSHDFFLRMGGDGSGLFVQLDSSWDGVTYPAKVAGPLESGKPLSGLRALLFGRRSLALVEQIYTYIYIYV